MRVVAILNKSKLKMADRRNSFAEHGVVAPEKQTDSVVSEIMFQQLFAVFYRKLVVPASFFRASVQPVDTREISQASVVLAYGYRLFERGDRFGIQPGPQVDQAKIAMRRFQIRA